MSEAKIWTRAGFVANDPWRTIDDETPIPAEGDVLLPMARLLALSGDDRAALAGGDGGNAGRLGVIVAPGDDLALLADWIGNLALIALSFPKFSDGRAFSHAARLREQYGYRGELRAVGDVLIDQIPLMLRVGIESFAVSNETALKRLAENRLPGISLHYQPTALPAAEAGGYSWRRQSA